jgi:hypothetical protein
MNKRLIKLPTGYFEPDDVREEYEYSKDDSFEFLEWKPRAVLIDKNGKTSSRSNTEYRHFAKLWTLAVSF